LEVAFVYQNGYTILSYKYNVFNRIISVKMPQRYFFWINVKWITLVILLKLSASHGGTDHSYFDEQEIVSDDPIFLDTLRNLTVGPGDRAVLKCRVDHLGTKTVTWRKQTQAHPLTIGLYTFVGDNRISVDYNQRLNEWSLIIQNVKPGDEGIYQCLISSKDEKLQHYNVQLNVKTVQVSGTDYVEFGSQIQLVCNATGKPDPPHDVEWIKDGKKIHSNAKKGVLITKKIETKVLISMLVIQKSSMTDIGYYICRSSNKDTGMIKVHVLNNDQAYGKGFPHQSPNTALARSSTCTNMKKRSFVIYLNGVVIVSFFHMYLLTSL